MNTLPDKSVMEHELGKAGHGDTVVHVFDQLESTSVWLREQAQASALRQFEPEADGVTGEYHCPASHLCVTDWQSAGIARRGRTWQTKPGNITFSLLTCTDSPPKDLLGLSLVTGIGVADCLAVCYDLPVKLKWPNDVLLRNAKLGGLLTEISAAPGKAGAYNGSQILTGIGINLLNDDDVSDLGIGAISLEAEGVLVDRAQRDLLIGKIAASVLSAHQHFYAAGWSAFAQHWQRIDWLEGKHVTLQAAQLTENAIARGVNEQGALLIERNNKVTPLYSGEVTVRPVPA